ncbi:ATP-binding protein [Actinoplanes sp. CA-054009]
MLLGRRDELEALDVLLRAVREGRSQALVLRGEAGSGKTALLDHLADRADPAQVVRASGIEPESELAYSALHWLCTPLLGHLRSLPEPQRAALETALGLSVGPAPESLLVGVAVLGLLAEAASARPLVCLVDDAQWIDAASLRILGFVARRLSAESVALVFAARDDTVLPGLPELPVRGLPDPEARALLDSVLTGPADARVRNRIVAETGGNPLALLELSRELSPAELTFGFGGPATAPIASRVEHEFQRRIAALPAETRLLLVAAALEPAGDRFLLRRTLNRLGINREAVGPAQAAGLIEIGPRVRFAHPLIRSAAWRGGDPAQLRAIHAALAEETDPAEDPDRRAWHRAHATAGPDEEVAGALAASAGRARARGGWAAAAAFLQRAAELTLDGDRRADLLIEAAAARFDAGSYAQVPELLAAAGLVPLDALRRARVERLRAQVAFALDFGAAAVPPLLAAARRLATVEPPEARDTFLTAIGAAIIAGRFGGDSLRAAAEAARESAPAGDGFAGRLLAGLVSWVLDGRAAAAPGLDRALDAMTPDDLNHFWLAAAVAVEMGRPDLLHRLSEPAVRHARESGTTSLLPNALAVRTTSLLASGRFADAARLMDEIDELVRATGASVYQWSRLALAAYRGPEQPARDLLTGQLAEAAAQGNGRLQAAAHLALAILENGLGHHEAAAASARQVLAFDELAFAQWALGELPAAEARERLTELAAVTPTRSARGAQALADALAGPPGHAEDRFREAVGLLSAPETALPGLRARLSFGEWLRRVGRRAEARTELRAAYDAFTAMGATVFADRAWRELAAAGEIVRRDQATAAPELTSQEATIARMAAAGQTNPEIARALFVSPRTVEWHLRKVFARLGITSRRELAAALGEAG